MRCPWIHAGGRSGDKPRSFRPGGVPANRMMSLRSVISVCRLCSRDRLFAGWARSELVALEVADLAFEPEGVVLRIRRSKTDREGAGATVAVPLGAEEGSCPVGGAEPLAGDGGDRRGPVFPWIDRHGHVGPTLSDRALAEIVVARASAAGLAGDFAGHSLRAAGSRRRPRGPAARRPR